MKKILVSSFAASALFSTSLFAEKIVTVDVVAAQAAVADLGPAETVKSAHTALANGNLSEIWGKLPASYQKDITKVIRTFGNKMDKDVYEAAFSTLSKSVQLLQNKKPLMLEMAADGANTPDKIAQLDKLKNGYDDATKILTTIFNSDISKIETLKNIDIDVMSKKMEPELKALMASAQEMADKEDKEKMNDLKNVKVKVTSQEGNKASLKLTYPSGKTEDAKLTLVEGRWVPTDMAEGWEEGVESMEQGLEKMNELNPQQKQAILTLLTSVDGIIAKLDKTAGKEEFQQVLQQNMMGLMMQFGMMSQLFKEQEVQ